MDVPVLDKRLQIAMACLKGYRRSGEPEQVTYWETEIDRLLDARLSVSA